MLNTFKQQLDGWGQFHPLSCLTIRPDSPSALTHEITNAHHAPYISRGMGRSYGDSAISSQGAVILSQQLNRIIDFNPTTGALHAEAGLTLADIIHTFLPRGYFLPVTPGTQFVTLGGAIAADVHGKNHHIDGAFSNFIDHFTLLTANGQTLHCSPTQNTDAYHATIGGMGLTGAILAAQIKLAPVQSAYINTTYQKARNLEHAIELFEQNADTYQYSVAWIDCLATGNHLGRSVLIQGNHATPDQLTGHAKANPLTPPPPKRRNIPFNFPNFALNKPSVKAFNKLYYAKHKNHQTIEDFNTFFYPLDSINNWNRIYGKRGFIQYQALLPPQTANAGTTQLLQAIAKAGMASFLAVFKKTGPATAGLLSFPKPGYTLALDLPNTGKPLLKLVAQLDDITLKHNGRLYLAKDSTMSPATFAAMYPKLEEFKAVKAKLDPHNHFLSQQARRLDLANNLATNTGENPHA